MSWFFVVVAAATSGRISGLDQAPWQMSRRALVASSLGFPAASLAASADFLQDVPLATDDFASRAFLAPRDDDEDENSPIESVSKKVIAKAKARALSSAGNSEGRQRPASSTESLRFSVRVARSDGTFSVRDDSEGDEPLFGDLDVGVFGDLAPANVALFLAFALGESPGYSSSLFDEIDGPLLIGGRMRGIDEREVFGERMLLYRDRELLGSNEDRRLRRLAAAETQSQLSHDRPGLLTRRRVSSMSPPSALLDFGITLAAAPQLDRDWIVVGSVENDKSGVLGAVRLLPTYSAEAVGDFSAKNPIAADVFKAERDLFRAAADAIGDTRGKSIFPGKILRRVEVTNVKVLKPSS